MMKAKCAILGLITAAAHAVLGDIAVSGDVTGAQDTASIQAALDAAKTTGGTVTLDAGTFQLDAQLMVTNGVKLVGQGQGKTILKPASGKNIRCVTLDGGATLEGVTVTGGKTGDGAGVKVVDGTVSWCTISGNTGACGGGVCFSNGKGRIDHSTVANNSASGAGGGIGMTGLAGEVVIDTCLVYGNASTAGSGGGVAVVTGNSKTVTILNSTITGNSTRYNGGGIHLKSADAILTNCILAGNAAATGGGVTGYANLPDLTVEGSSTTGSDYCLFGTSQESVGTHSTVGTAPFVGNGDYHLSAAKELGYTDATGTCLDLDGTARSGALDVGCYEYGSSAQPEPPHVDPSNAVAASGDTTGANDTKTIQDLIDAAAPNHGAVTLGSGTFYLNKCLMVTNGVTLIGQGWANTILRPASAAKIRCVALEGTAKLEGVTLTGGNAAYGAGALVTDGTISWCCISNNVATGGYGGGVSFTNGRGGIDHSIVAGNQQTGTSYGAGIGMNNQTGSVTIDTCLIYGNGTQSGSGGGVMAEHIGSGKAVIIQNSTITGNTTRYNAGGVHVKNGDNGTCVLINSILSGNSAGSNVPNSPDLTLENASVSGSSYCLFGTSAEAVGSNYAVGTAPFVGNGDYRLSEAKELGYSDDEGTCIDLDNNGRRGMMDVGCYEFGGSAYVERAGATLYID